MSGKIQVRLAVLAAVAAIVALFAGALTAQADTVRKLRFDVIPATTTALTPTSFTAAATNDVSSTKDMGYVRVEVPSFVSLSNVAVLGTFAVGPDGIPLTNDDSPITKTWIRSGAANLSFDLSATDSASTLLPGEYVKVTFDGTPPNNTNADRVHDFVVIGKQSNDDNEAGNAPGNLFSERDYDRPGTFEFRNGDGTTSRITLQTDEVLVTGLAVDCQPDQPCSGTLRQFNTTVTVTANCGANGGTLLLDTVEIANVTQIGAAAFYDAFDGCDVLRNEDFDDDQITPEPLPPQITSANSPYIVTVDFTFDNSLIDSKGGLKFAAIYAGDASEFDPKYVGDNTPLPSCKKDIVVNCVAFIKGGPGITQAQVKMLLKDPFSRGF